MQYLLITLAQLARLLSFFLGRDSDPTDIGKDEILNILARPDSEPADEKFTQEPVEFRYKNLTSAECNSIQGCFSTSTNCTGSGIFDVDLTRHCSNFEAQPIFRKIVKLDASRPIQLQIYDKASVAKDFGIVRMHVVALKIWGSMDEYTTSRLPSLKLPNLVRLDIIIGHSLKIMKDDFRSNMKLRYISFNAVSFASIETDAFSILPELKHLGLEHYFFSLLEDPEYQVSATQLHCGCENRWLRAWLEKNPSLIASKSALEVRSMGVFSDEAIPAANIYLPVDCKNHNVTEFWGEDKPQPFSINDCL